jgi:hypothetical protein
MRAFRCAAFFLASGSFGFLIAKTEGHVTLGNADFCFLILFAALGANGPATSRLPRLRDRSEMPEKGCRHRQRFLKHSAKSPHHNATIGTAIGLMLVRRGV